MNDGMVEQLLSDIRLTNPAGYELVQETRKAIYAAVPKASERVMYGGFMFAATAQFCGVFAYTEHVEVVIPPKSNRKEKIDCDYWLYKERHAVECMFGKLKHYRRIATRYEKKAGNYSALFPTKSGIFP